MTAGTDSLVLGPSEPVSLHPDLNWLEETLVTQSMLYSEDDDRGFGDGGDGDGSTSKKAKLSDADVSSSSSSSSTKEEEEEEKKKKKKKRVKVVTLVNPGNPTGVTLTAQVLERCAALCRQHGVWLVVDNTYEHFAGAW
jgi:hypothetical protein